ncbi:isochorismatase hydrolase [Candidatus Moduliflexus flocculans]|uniref:Isochorismatase hydrolase n=1 Tax=Candidatus Moduliflexus flocculans TaxID=1499966 RepID=A0A081BQI1_9BACT|nr:isochorismatase hydrolase [Candidatus Moduliflexus flocculans]
MEDKRWMKMLQCDDTALILIDVQEKLVRVMHEKELLVTHLCQLVNGALTLSIPILWFEQNPAGLGATIPELSERLNGQTPIIKQSFSCCAHPGVWPQIEQLRRRQFLIAGIEAHVCVYQTGIELLQRGYDVQIVSDAVSSRSSENKQIGLTRIQQAGGGITSVEMALFELLKVAEGQRFKDILRIIK